MSPIAHVTANLVVGLLRDAAVAFPVLPSDEDRLGPRVVPRDLRQWLARLRLLEGVPFAYLAPDAALLPPESVRFFYVDRRWTDALIQGALSVGTVNTADRAQLERLHRRVRDEIDEEERVVRLPGGEGAQRGPAGAVTGFLLRSRAVSGWPGLHVRAYREEVGPDDEIVPESHPSRVKLLRLERLAPAVLLALFDGIPAVVHLEEPRQGVQFGVRLERQGETATFRAQVPARDTQTAERVPDPAAPGDETRSLMMPVAFRPGSPGVLDLEQTARTFIGTAPARMGPRLDAAEFALQMIRFPFRQVFGDPSQGAPAPIRDVFRPTVAYQLPALQARFAEVLR